MRHSSAAIILICTIHFVFLSSCNHINKSDNDSISFTKDSIISDIDMVLVSKGAYKKGLHCEQSSISYDYWIGKYEITNTQYHKFILEALEADLIFLENDILYYIYPGDELVPKGKYRVKMFDDRIFMRNDSILLQPSFANHPAISVTWFGCMAFCNYYGFSLPSEAEWEKAARGNKCTNFPWGDSIDSSYANYLKSKDPFEIGTTPVGFYNGQKYKEFQTSDAKSAYGCYDMSGNAWEWTSDRFLNTPYNLGKGGGFNIHFPASLQVYYISSFGVLKDLPLLDLCHLPDGFRVVHKNIK